MRRLFFLITAFVLLSATPAFAGAAGGGQYQPPKPDMAFSWFWFGVMSLGLALLAILALPHERRPVWLRVVSVIGLIALIAVSSMQLQQETDQGRIDRAFRVCNRYNNATYIAQFGPCIEKITGKPYKPAG